MSVTVNEIARICNVSRTTVLRALNNQSRVSDATRKRIQDVANELGYRPNLLARSFNTGRTMMIGFVAINVENMVFVESLSAINQEAIHHGYSLNIALTGESRETEIQHIREFADRRMEGILLSAVNKGKKYEDFLKSLNVPIVCIGNDVCNAFSTVMIDEAQAAKDAVKLIMSKGYQRIVFVCPPLTEQDEVNVYSHIQRTRGFEGELHLHPHIEKQVISGKNYIDQLVPILNTLTTRTAILCSGDIYALDIMRYFKAHRIKTPRDIGIMGFDNIKMLEFVVPRLTTVSTNVEQVAAVAVNELMYQITDTHSIPKKIVLPHQILDMETL